MSTENWKENLNIPTKDLRPQTDDIVGSKNETFESFNLKRELLMGLLRLVLKSHRQFKKKLFLSP